jgi:DNA topoisomerase-1
MNSDAKVRVSKRFAAQSRLRYVNGSDLTIQRAGAPNRFRYLGFRNARVRGQAVLARIERLAIPPAWTDVRICRDPAGHLQAVGKDARGRKQYRYHERWSRLRNENKFDRLLDFGRALPRIRRAVSRDLRQPGLPQQKVLAAIVRLLELSAARVGNEEYVDQNRSYGLTTLRNRHAQVSGDTLRLTFRGKSGKEQDIGIRHPALARVVRKCQHLPGQKLFGYADERGVHAVSSEEVNDYLARITGQGFTAKDFRTWKATAVATSALLRAKQANMQARRKNIGKAIEQVAEHLGNTPAICKKSYIHPAILESYLKDALATPPNGTTARPKSRNGLAAEEKTLLALLRNKRAARGRKAGIC